VTTVYVTHDQEEALRLADRIVVMAGGVILQAGSAAEVYDEPADLFVARFVGSPGMNFVAGELVDEGGARRLHPKPPPTLWGRAQGPSGGPPGFTLSPEHVAALPLPAAAAALPLGPVTLGIRPEFLVLDPTSALRGRVEFDEYLGSSRCLHVETPVGRLVARVGPAAPVAGGDEVGLRADRAYVRLFETATGRRLG
jgi:ABC-type sugar transport system ATPase subunit